MNFAQKKSVVLALVMLGMWAAGFSSCQKEETTGNNEASISLAKDESAAEDLFADAFDLADMYMENMGGSGKTADDCPTVTSSTPAGTFPKTITIDFGDSCEGEGGRIRSGQIIVTISDTMSNAGATKTRTYQNYFVNGIQVQGTHTTTNNGVNAEGNPTFTHTLTDGSLTFTDGSTATRQSVQTITTIAGWDTPPQWDNVWAITGNSNGVNRNGIAYSTLITEPLIKRRNCRWIVSGTVEITRNDQTATLNYGNGACNRFATLTTPDGETHEIQLPL
ncbi:MAG TPA: hypothetical protein PK239_08735 [Chitinophagales bacterium]|nr:hypothetical protein [Chitinophagales bacterium]